MNPVLRRELRERVRGNRAVLIVTTYLALLVALFWVVYLAQAGGRSGAGVSVAPTEVARVGRGIFEWVLFAMLILVMFIVPGLAAGAIAGERERQTLIPMQVTKLSAPSIVTGKVMASFAFLLLLLLVSAPLFSLSYLIGGISLAQSAKSLGVVVLTGVVLSCLAVACSAMARRVQTATVFAYGVVFVMVLGTFLVYATAGLLTEESGSDESGDPPAAILYANPLALAASVMAPAPEQVDAGERTNSPFQPIRELIEPIRREEGADASTFNSFIFASVAVQGGLALIALVVASRRLRIPAEVER